MAKILITVCFLHVLLGMVPNPPEFSLLILFLMAYHHGHFLASSLEFISFFAMAFLGGCTVSYLKALAYNAQN